jgi:glycosyltransferase involved in cell wall biosynthesis
VPNGVHLEHFARARQPGPRPAEWQGVVAPGRPVIGYYGALARWFDYALVAQAAGARPGYEFVLIGPDHDGTLRSSGLLAQPNVRWLGPVRYERLPEHVRAFDVATIPFVVDAVTHSVSPLKLFEYMAAGRPIVITAMEESLRYPGPLLARTAAEFPARLDQALALRGDAVHQAELARVAEANTWRERAARVLAALDERRPPAGH